MHKPDAETAILSLVLNNQRIFDKVSLSGNDFYSPTNRALWEAGLATHFAGMPVDPIEVSEKVEASGVPITVQDIVDIQKSFASEAALNSYATTIKNARRVRDLQNLSFEISEIANGQGGVDEKEDRVAQLFNHHEPQGNDLPEQCNEAIKGFLEELDRRSQVQGVTGLATGINALDERTNGLQDSDFILLAARPSMGKTALGLNISRHAVFGLGKRVLFFSLEMSKQQLMERVVSDVSNVYYGNIRKGQLEDTEWTALSNAITRMKDQPLFIDDTPGLTIHQIRARSRALHRRSPLSLIVIDYLQLIRNTGRTRTEEVGEISMSLKELAKELNIPVLCLSQLNRECESRSDRRPRNADLRDSGSLEQDADQIFFIYRDEVYFPDSESKGIAEIICGKFRGGEIGTDYLKSELHHQRFVDLPSGYEPQKKENVYNFG